MKTNVVAIFGATGFIGSALADSMEASGWTVVRPMTRPGERIDIGGPVEQLIEAIADAHVVVNAAGRAHVHSPDPEHFWVANAVGAFQVAVAAREAPSVRRLVHVSSAAVGNGGLRPPISCSPPINAYGASKAAGELAVGAALQKADDTELVVVRPAGVGGAQSPGSWGTIRRRIAANSIVPLPNSDVRFDVVEIEMLTEHLRSAVVGEMPPGVYSSTGGAPVTLREYAEALAAEHHAAPRLVPVSATGIRFAGSVAAGIRRLTRPLIRVEQLAETMTAQRPLIEPGNRPSLPKRDDGLTNG